MQYTFRVVSITQSLISKLTPRIDKIPVWLYIIGFPAIAGLDVYVRRLCNWVFAQAKIEIVYSRFRNTGVVGLNV